MKVEIDARPQKNNDKPFYAIRLFPETNEEMAQLEWAKTIEYNPQGEFLRNAAGDTIHYAIIFDGAPEEDEAPDPEKYNKELA